MHIGVHDHEFYGIKTGAAKNTAVEDVPEMQATGGSENGKEEALATQVNLLKHKKDVHSRPEEAGEDGE